MSRVVPPADRSSSSSSSRRTATHRSRPSSTRTCTLLACAFVLISTAGTLFHLVKTTGSFQVSKDDNSLVIPRTTPVRNPSQRQQDAERAIRRAELAATRNRLVRLGTTPSAGYPRQEVPTTTTSPLPLIHQFNYSQPTMPSRFTLSDPQLYVNDTAIILILSARGNFDRRTAIRDTWGRDHPIYFVVGGPHHQERHGYSHNATGNLTPELFSSNRSITLHNETTQRRLESEQAQFHDIVDSIHPDSYMSLTHKVRFAYRWILEHHPHVEWLVKVDDDTVVRVDTLSQVFLRNFNPYIPMVIGRIIEKSQVPRTGKWADHLYPYAFYPFWPQGSCGHVVSRVVAEFVAFTPGLVYYQGEDISIGIWLDESDLHTSWVHSSYFSNDRKCLNHAWLIMGHEVTESEMRECYQHADEWPLEDIKHKHRRFWKVENLYQRKD